MGITEKHLSPSPRTSRRLNRNAHRIPVRSRLFDWNDNKLWIGLILLLLCQCGALYFLFSGPLLSSYECQVSFGAYKGHIYREHTQTVGEPKCLIESKWMRVQQHAVKVGSNVINDWLWIDYHDRINVLVQDSNGNFVVVEQTKYALEGRMSKAVIGGIIEPGENYRTAAHREVEEELGFDCKNMHFLGRFRTDVNRGMGWVHALLARDCKKVSKLQQKEEEGDVVGEADLERQDTKRISLKALETAVSRGEFIEVQWSNTVALAILHLRGQST